MVENNKWFDMAKTRFGILRSIYQSVSMKEVFI